VTTELAPRHLRLREQLIRRWKTDGVRAGDRIESQNEIMKFCDFSLITVIKTLKDLEADGIIRRQVGKGSFLVRAPWTEAHHRVGFFYNRDVVGGGIFNNEFYTKLVVTLEKAVVSDGHEFILGSFTNAKMPMAVWDALDVIVLTSITGDTNLDFLDKASSQISVIDQTLIHPKVHSYRIDYGEAFREMFGHFDSSPLRVLYLDSEIRSNEQRLRLKAAKAACAERGADCALEVIKVNQEMGITDVDAIKQALARHDPDIVFGYSHSEWIPMIESHTRPTTKIYAFVLDSDRPGFAVRTDEWMQTILPVIYANLEDRRAKGAVNSFPARFQP
jgi:hypothetical protein